MSGELDKQEKIEKRFAEAIAEIAHSPMGYFIGFGIMISLIYLGIRWDGHIFDRKGCVEVQERNGKFLKVDTCSGSIEELELNKNKVIDE
ncbi:hypothetical protein AAW30_01492 [Arcobacter porcinus]|uniref:hypothetical protein n=1 Tax=Arcobacteraceae TaxID=2808963 RepID=UPI0008249521|nr:MULTISPECIES: hypothetical protein [Arcobacteraceae]MDX3960253.1 hypothetical protein [Aliarcobacter skirrowii]OCL82668.1 hypothetical protein AAW30_01492 [Arcobacter porcinus]